MCASATGGLYGERGLAGEQAVVWLYREQLTVAFADVALAQDQATYQPDDRHMAAVTATEVFETPYRSPQPANGPRFANRSAGMCGT
jgi:hypothetical protein